MKAVLDAGPLIHLREIGCDEWTNLFSVIFCPPAVFDELSIRKESLELLKKKVYNNCEIDADVKRQSEFIYSTYCLGPGESQAIALAAKKGIKLLLTDDLEARIIAKKFQITPVGTAGILLRLLKDGHITQQKLEKYLKKLCHESSLFITPDLINHIIKETKKNK